MEFPIFALTNWYMIRHGIFIPSISFSCLDFNLRAIVCTLWYNTVAMVTSLLPWLPATVKRA